MISVMIWQLELKLFECSDVLVMVMKVVVTGADGPHGLVGDDDVEHLFGRHVHQILHDLHGTHLVVQTTEEDPSMHAYIIQSIN